MNIIPKIKNIKYTGESVNISNINWTFSENIDGRLVKAADKITKSVKNGFDVYVEAGNDKSEAYTIEIAKKRISIKSSGAAGAFYGLKTFSAMLSENNGTIECCTINDSPDMQYRGFYHDVTRGRVPKIETLKRLVDTMTDYKLNSLQLYVEHAYEFKEYSEVRALGYMTKEEILALDEYCYDNFIDLIPSFSTFGHLYHLLECEKYKHLCELDGFVPKSHHFLERMAHHTINPLKDESFELIKSLIDQYMPLFRSDTFNICCDETFDLCRGVNKGKDPAKLYCGFVRKIAEYVASKGKKVMMWGDIILKYPEYIKELPENIVFLNWDYSPEPSREQVKKFSDSGRKQIVCPGTSTWNEPTELVSCEEFNISRLAGYGYEFGADGILNTNWGDYGNIAGIKSAMYGLICGAAVGWRRETVFDHEFRKNVSESFYGDGETVELIDKMCALEGASNWGKLLRAYSAIKSGGETAEQAPDIKDVCTAISTFKSVHSALEEKPIKKEIKEELILAADFRALIAKWYAKCFNIDAVCYVNFDLWVSEYESKWLEENKRSELDELLKLFAEFERM